MPTSYPKISPRALESEGTPLPNVVLDFLSGLFGKYEESAQSAGPPGSPKRYGWMLRRYGLEYPKEVLERGAAGVRGELSPEEVTQLALEVGLGGLGSSFLSGATGPATVGMFLRPRRFSKEQGETLFSFLKKRSKFSKEDTDWFEAMLTWDKDFILTKGEGRVLEGAVEQAVKGMSPEDVWKEIGWWKAPMGEGKRTWLTEIPDEAMKLVENPPGTRKPGGIFESAYGNLLEHEELRRAAPDFWGARVRLNPRRSGGSFFPTERVLETGTLAQHMGSKDSLLNILAHETEHLIQAVEGWPSKGTNVAIEGIAARDEYYRTKAGSLQRVFSLPTSTKEELYKFLWEPPSKQAQLLPSLRNKYGDELVSHLPDTPAGNAWVTAEAASRYRRNTGEAIARLVESRRGLSKGSLKRLTPEEDLTQMLMREYSQGQIPKPAGDLADFLLRGD